MANNQPEVLAASTVVSSVIGFTLGLVSAWIVEFIKRRQEKQRLINLFLAEIGRTHLEIDSRREAPVGKIWGRGRFALLGIADVHFSGIPEYELEVYNARLYETEGVRLAQQLGPEGRRCFWAVYGFLREAEAVRGILKRRTEGDQVRAVSEGVREARRAGERVHERPLEGAARGALFVRDGPRSALRKPQVGLFHAKVMIIETVALPRIRS